MSIEFKETQLDKLLNRKIRISVIIVTVFFLFVVLRLCYLQILKGSKYVELSTNNRIRITKLTAPRGRIFSSDNQTLVDNTPSFDLNLIPQDTPDVDAVLTEISRLLALNKSALKKLITKKKGRPPFEPITLKKELSWNEMSLVLSKKIDLKGISISVVPKRLYGLGNLAPHVFGFLGEVDREELQRFNDIPYDIGDLIGKYGLEKWAEQWLRGSKGGLQTEVDVYGNRKKVLAEISPVTGNDLKITLLPAVQQTAKELLQGKTGAVVAIDPRSGRVLALASAPAFDSNLFSRGIDPEEWNNLVGNPYHPLLNRAIQSQQPPGSVFKIVTVIAALEEKIIDPKQTFYCPGFFDLGNRRFKCWKKHGHGNMDMRSGLVNSCDTYFYNLALKVGVERIVRYAKMLGFGRQTGIELEDEKPGLLPSPTWKKNKYNSSWQRGETLNLAIGQGFLLATPIQIAAVYCGLAQNGIIYKPRLVETLNKEKKAVAFEKEILQQYTLSKDTLSFLKDALAGVVQDQHGTGYRARIPGHPVAGKTGTAQVASSKLKPEDKKNVPRHLRNHAWFAAFSPVEKPEIVVCVLLEHGESGGKYAAPIAREIINAYYQNKNQQGGPNN